MSSARDPGIDWQAILDHGRRMVGWLQSKHLLSSEDAEDVAAETIARAWIHRATLRTDLNLAGWLNVTASRVAIDLRRRRMARPTEVRLDGPALVIASDSSPAREVERADEAARVASVLATLPPKYSALLFDAYGAGHTIPFVAARHDMPEGTVKTRLRRGRELFLERWVQPIIM